MHQTSHPGPIALVGSGEYLEAMEETDRALLDRVGGPAHARVVVIPTASGLEEPGSPARWVQLGLEHFTRLGAHVDAAVILSHTDAQDPRWSALCEQSDFFYFSGGNPQHLIEVMAGSSVWDVIRRRHQDGAVLAGCSAGAMAICGLTSRFRALREDGHPDWVPALGVLPHLIVMPHFDRMAGFVGQDVIDRLVTSLPAGMTLLGIDEETALVRLSADMHAGEAQRWLVLGRQTVSVFVSGGGPTVYQSGQPVILAAG